MSYIEEYKKINKGYVYIQVVVDGSKEVNHNYIDCKALFLYSVDKFSAEIMEHIETITCVKDRHALQLAIESQYANNNTTPIYAGVARPW